jgi:hypothetical protein
MLAAPRVQLSELRRFIRELEEQFLVRHLSGPALDPPTTAEQLDAAAYVVLSHGALERFVEGLALWVLERAVDSWKLKKRTTASTVSMLWYSGAPSLPKDGDRTASVFDRVRRAMDEEKRIVSDRINDNHGVSARHLQTLFYPLGVNVPDDTVLIPSLEKVATMRHQWAHQYHFGARVVTSAPDVKKVVDDCLVFAQKLASNASAARP